MPVSIGVVMDPIASIKPYKDSTFAMMLAAQARGWTVLYLEMADLALRDGRPWGRMRPVEVRDDNDDWFRLGEAKWQPLSDLDILLMRKDPPFDMEYVYSTFVLERAAAQGADGKRPAGGNGDIRGLDRAFRPLSSGR